MIRAILIALLVAACSTGAPAVTPTAPVTPVPASLAAATATPTAALVATPAAPTEAPTVAPTVAPATTDPYYNPDDKYTPRPTAATTPDAVTEEVEVSVSPDGSYLVGPNGMTLYTFDNDSENESACSGGCAAAWPPLAVEHDQVLVAGDGVDGELAVFHRPDDTHQASYEGQPLYYYQVDQQPGDTTGDGVNGTWHLALP